MSDGGVGASDGAGVAALGAGAVDPGSGCQDCSSRGSSCLTGAAFCCFANECSVAPGACPEFCSLSSQHVVPGGLAIAPAFDVGADDAGCADGTAGAGLGAIADDACFDVGACDASLGACDGIDFGVDSRCGGSTAWAVSSSQSHVGSLPEAKKSWPPSDCRKGSGNGGLAAHFTSGTPMPGRRALGNAALGRGSSFRGRLHLDGPSSGPSSSGGVFGIPPLCASGHS